MLEHPRSSPPGRLRQSPAQLAQELKSIPIIIIIIIIIIINIIITNERYFHRRHYTRMSKETLSIAVVHTPGSQYSSCINGVFFIPHTG